MLSNNQIASAFDKHIGFIFSESRLQDQITAILFAENGKVLKQQLMGNKPPVVSVHIHKTPEGHWLHVCLTGSTADIRLAVQKLTDIPHSDENPGYKLLKVISHMSKRLAV